MSEAARILNSLAEQGVVLWGEGSRLRYRAAKGAFTEQMRSQLTSNKDEILASWRSVAANTIETHPATYGQRALWFLQQSLPDSAAYNVVFTARVRSWIDTAALKNSCQALVDRHPSLRTTYKMQDDTLTQQVQGFLPVHFQTHHRASVDSGQLREEVIRASRVPFDLERGPLVRVELFTKAQDDHVLLITVHHIAADGWSLFLLLDDLRQVYASECETGKLPAPRPLHEVAEFARWQKQMLSRGEGKSHEEYWMHHLAGELAPLNLPTDRPRPTSFTTQGATLGIDLGRELSKAVRELALREGVTPYVLLLAAYQVLLHRYTGQPEVIVGSPTYGRDQAEFSDVVGDFINMIPLRARITGDLNFREFLAQARQTVLEGIQHQDYPFPRLVEKLQPVRDPSRSPVFQTLFVLQKFKQLKGFEGFFAGSDSAGRLDWGGLVIEPFSITQQEGQFELSLELVEHDGVFRGDLKYNTELYNAATVERLGRHYVTLLRSICASPDTKVSRLALMDRTELEQLADDWKAAERHYPRDVCLHQLIEAQAERTPESVGVAFEGRELTYGELDKRANQLANFLQKRGVQADTLVGICMERSMEMVIGLLGILKAGGAYVPMDPSYPECRLAFMLEDAGVGLLLTQQHLKPILPSHGAEVICLDAEWGRIASESTDKPEQRAQAEHLAYIIYTSGSTGQPKGAMNAHVGIVNRLLWMQDEYQLTSADAVLQKTPFSFDVSVWEFFWPLLAGARLVIARPGGHQDPAYLIDVIAREHVTVIHFVPSMLRMFLAAHGLDRCSSLREVIASGEALSAELVKAFHARLSANLHNLYGPTEAAVDVTYWPCPRQSDLSVVPIGRSVANTRCYILDPQLQPVPAGVPGELCLGGIQVGRGYHKRPELTAEKFISDPFRKENGARLYRTGDLCRRLADGTIEYLGRLDHQVKIRGFRIELGEVEVVLKRNPSVEDAVVLAREGEPGDRQLVAYVVPQNGEPTRDWRGFLRGKLPDYMIPSTFVVLDKLPLTPNGKIDRNALPAPERQLEGYKAPRTPQEQILCEIFAEVLKLDRVGIDDNFFSLGGDSILSILLASRCRRLGLELGPQDVFHLQTAGALAAAVRSPEAPDQSKCDAPTAIGEIIPTPIMRWFLERGGPIDHFNQSVLLRVPSGLTESDLVAMLQALIDGHDMLRVSLLHSEGVGGWKLCIAPQGSVKAEGSLTRVDLAGLNEEARREKIRAAVREAQGQLNPKTGRIAQAVWFVGDEPERLALVIHHLAVDGVSWRILVADLEAAWSALLRGARPKLEPAGTSFRAWAQHLAEAAQLPALLEELPVWESILESGSSLIPGGVIDPARDTFASARHVRIELPTQVTAALLTKVPAAFHAQINDVLLGALAVSVACWRKARGQETDGRILVHLEGHGREPMAGGLDLSRTVGWFTSLFPVGLDLGPLDIEEALAGGPCLGPAIKRVKEQLRAIPGRGLGYGLLRYMRAESKARLIRHADPQIGFNYLGRFSADETNWSPDAQGTTLVGRADPDTPLAHVIDINALTVDRPTGPCLSAMWSWASALCPESDARFLAESWRRTLEALVRHVEQPGAGGYTVSDFTLVSLSSAQLEQLECAYPALEDILPLSPLQEGLLFHSLYDPSAPDFYTIQIEMEFEGMLDPVRMQGAVRALLRRHANLRAAFCQEGFERPVQVIVRDADVPWRQEDFSVLDRETQDMRRNQFLAADLAQRFDPTAAPLLRFALLGLGRKRNVLVSTNHHLLLDGWSLPIFLGELLTLYRSGEHETELPPVRPYSEYLTWLAGQDPDVALAAWRDYLNDLDGPTLLAPPSRGGTSPVSTDYWQSDLPRELADRLKELARERNLTLNTIIQGLWAVLLGRSTGREDVVFGVTVSGRPAELPGVEEMVGLFINTLPLRVRLNPERSLAALLTDIQESQARLLPFQHARLAEIKQQARCGELFDTLVVFENYPLDNAMRAEPTNGLRLASVQGRDVTHYPLSLKVAPREQLRLRIDFDPVRFERATAESIASRFLRLLDEAVATPNAPLHRLEILSPQEKHRILNDFNDKGLPLPDATLPELFEERVEQSPEATALVLEEESLSYQELKVRTDRLTAYLRNRGVRTGSRVGICMDRSLEMIVGMLAVLKAGGVYVPLDPAYPAERLAFILNEVAAPVILTIAEVATSLPATTAQVICLDRDWPLIEDDGSTQIPCANEAPPAVTSQDLAYVIFTSGSTGTPKGVAVPHCAIIRLVLNTNYVELGPQDRIAHLSNVCFDAATFEIWGALLNGACVVVVPKAVALDPTRFGAELNRHKVGTLFVTTALFNELAREDGKIFQGLNQVLFGGEAVNPESVRRVLESGGAPCRLLHVYGPTECTTFATFYAVNHVERDATSIPIGRPISNTTAYVLDKHGNPVPVGVPGELYLGGEGLAQGYLNQPELTRERFVPNHLGGPGPRLYRTGDVVKFLPDGNIEFIGRCDGQVKIRGFRIEPGEVEVVLKVDPGVEDAVVVAREDTPGDRELVAYLVPHNGQPTKDWAGFLRGKLPDYMIPSAFVVLDKLPLTPNGKVDRRALPAPERQLEGFRAPRTPQEEILCEIFAELFNLDRVGIDDNFFELGGHSILAMQLLSRVRNTLRAQLDVRAVFEAPTVAEFAARLDGSEDSGAGLEARARPERLPLSHAQERFWFLDQLEGSRAKFKIRQAVRFRGDLNREALECAARALFERHEVLRIRFAEKDGVPHQIVEATTPVVVEFEDLSENGCDLGEQTINSVLLRQAEEPFRLGDGRLLRLWLIKLGQRDHIVHWCCHHIVSDGWSVGIFNRELSALYSAFCEEQPSPLPPLALQYPDYALWQREYLQGKTLEQLVDYWRDRLEGCPTLELPLDHPRPAFQTYRGAMASFVFSDALNRELRQLSKRENATIFMTLLAALKVLLFRYTGQEDIAVGIPIANRGRAGLENLIGCLLNTLVVRSRVPGADSFRDVLRRVRNELLGAYAHQELPFEKLLEELRPERSLNRTPLFQVFVNFMHFESVAPLFSGLEAQPLPSAQIEAKFDIEFYIADFEQRLRIDLVYNSDLFEAATIERMLERFEVLLEAIVADPEKEIGAMALLTAEDRRGFTVQDNCVQPTNSFAHFAPGDLEQSIVSRFEEQARNFPDRLAVKTKAYEWTYAELNRISKVIARAILHESGEASHSVALLFEHDAPMIAALFGALTAGKAYVPLDPSHPKTRLAYIIEDAQAQLLVTDKANRRLANELSGNSIRVIEFPAPEEGESDGPPGRCASPDDTAYLLYTSGSSGDPKGVTQVHRNVLHHIRNYTNSLRICSDDRLLLLASYGFDAAVMDIFGALLNGATLLPFDIRKHDFIELADWIDAQHVTIYHSTPTVFRHFSLTVPRVRKIMAQTRLIVLGGEQVLSQDFDLFRKRSPDGCILVNGYGQTEYSFSLQYLADSRMKFRGDSMPIGYPLDDAEVFLVDSEGHPGQVFGEIAIRSPYLAQGYWRRPELTESAFKEDPHGGNLRTYRTGDTGRLRVDGAIEFLGRKDFQVKIRGNRVEPAEVAAVIAQYPEMQDCAVVARSDGNGEKILVAYLVPKPTDVSIVVLREFLKQRLPDYMMPTAFVKLEKLPLTPNGKLDRKALPALESVDRQARAEYVPPRTTTEQIVAQVFEEVLSVECVGLAHNFFELGGHSLSAARMVSRLRTHFHVESPVRALFEFPTVEGLSRYIDTVLWTTRSASVDPNPSTEEHVSIQI